MLIADSVSFKGRHDQLLTSTSLAVARGTMLLVVADTQISRTALSLILSGRMKPTTGTVTLNDLVSLKNLRSKSAIVDAPGINEPESHMKTREIIAEELSLIPTPLWRKRRAKHWISQHGYEDIASGWIDAIDPMRRLELLTKLGMENNSTELLVIDSPDRHDLDNDSWLEVLERFAQSRRSPTVIAVVSRVPDRWQGQVIYVGNDLATEVPTDLDAALTHLAPSITPAEPEPDPTASERHLETAFAATDLSPLPGQVPDEAAAVASTADHELAQPSAEEESAASALEPETSAIIAEHDSSNADSESRTAAPHSSTKE